MKIPIVRPWFDESEEQAVIDVLRSGWVGQGKRVEQFEEEVAQFVGAQYATAVSSCTAALHLAALAAGFGPGDEVLVPAFTWISTPNAVELTGATPVFCDIDRATFNIDVEDARKRITSRTKGICAVHLFGLAAEIREITGWNLTVIEDAACALGSRYNGAHVGNFGAISCFSFHPRKSITTGEGGMLLTKDPKYRDAFLRLRNIGLDKQSGEYSTLGFNYRMTDLQAAVGLVQFRKLNEILQRRNRIAQKYNDLIAKSSLGEWLEPPYVPANCTHAYQAYVCRIKGTSTHRDQLIKLLAAEGIETRQGTHAPVLLDYYRKKYGLRPGDFPQAVEADKLTIALPLYPQLTESEQEWICSRLQSLWEQISAS